MDEDLKPEDFGLTDIGILPTNPFYFVKDIRRGVVSIFTRDPAAKAELRLQYAAEKLLEAKEVAKKESSNDGDKEHAINNFTDELEEVRHRVEIASERLDEDQSKELSKKVLDATMKYGKSLGKIEKDISPEIFLSVKEAKDATSETLVSTFGLVEPEVVSNQIGEVLNQQKGSEFKDFKNLEVLKEVETRVPEKAKEAIKTAQSNALNRLQAELEKFDSAKKAIFEEFVKESGGSEIRHLEIMGELEARPISKDLRDVILGTKELVFSKAETRLNGLSQENKEKFAEHLGEGNLEDFRILRELQNNIASGIISGISNVVSRAEAEFVKKIESTGQNEVQKKDFLGSIERFHDAKSISVLNEIEKLIPDDKKNFFAELKSKAVQEIRNDVSRAANSSQRQSVYDSLAGDHPEDFAALDKFGGNVNTPFDIGSFVESIKRAQQIMIQNKIERIFDKERLARYEEGFKKLKNEIPNYTNFDRFFEQRKDIFESPEKALKKIEEAEKALAEFRGIRTTLPYDTAYKGGGFDQMLRDIENVLAFAERKLEIARTVLSYNDIGRAFGEAQSAENMARDGIALANKYKSGVKETKCPFYYPPPSSFCINGAIVHQTDQNGCPLPPRCEARESKECPVINYSQQDQCPSGTHRETLKDEKGCFVVDKCVPDIVTCQAYFEGYVFDNSAQSCKKQSFSGCSDPYVYHTFDECTKAHTKINICPSLPTVASCPTGEHKVVIFSSPECGTYYGCEKDIVISTPQCSDGKDNDNDGQTDYPADTGCYGKEDNDEGYYTSGGCNNNKVCESNESYASCSSDCSGSTTSKWVGHVWKFKDGLIVDSQILNRTDSEYLAFISGIEKQCLEITKDKFAWKSGAGNDAPENWQNFGIPDCSGTAVNYVCGNNVCDSGETMTSCPSDCKTITTVACNNNNVCEYEESYESCPKDCTSVTTSQCTYTTEATCNTNSVCAWISGFGCGVKAQCNDKIDNDKDGLIDMADSGCADNFDNDEFAPTTTSATCSTTASACADSTSCANSHFYWYDNVCNSAPRPNSCAASADYCINETECKTGGWYWCNNDCYNTGTACGQTTTTTTTTGTCSTASSCTTQSNCTTSNFFWYDNSCHSSPQTTTTTTTTNGSGCGSNTTSATCEANSACDWINSACSPTTYTSTACNNNNVCDSGESSTSCPSDCGGSTTSSCTYPSNCFDSAKCTSSGWFWYNGGCWSSPQSSGGASVLQSFWNSLLGL